MGLDGDDVLTRLQCGSRNECLGLCGDCRTIARGRFGSRVVVDGAGPHTGAVDLDAIDVHDCTIIGQVLQGDPLEGVRVVHGEARPEVGGHRTGPPALKLRGDTRIAVAQGGRSGRPVGVVEGVLCPVLGSRTVVGTVAPGCTGVQKHRVRGVRLSVSRRLVGGRGGRTIACGINGAHEEAVLATARHRHRGRVCGSDRPVVTQDLVGCGVGDAFPRQRHRGFVGRGASHGVRRLGSDVVTCVVSGKATVPLRAGSVDVGQGEVSSHPQVAVGVGGERPGARPTLRE